MRRNFARVAAALVLLCSAVAAEADDLPFSGSMTGVSSGGPDASCAPLPFHTMIAPGTTIGTSSLGAFTYSSDVCQGGGPVVGTFVFDFGIDSFEGTQSGTAIPSAIPGVFDLLLNYTILDGTGRFLGATGALTGTGTADTRSPPTQIALTFTGNINAPAVPEPATWGLMIMGFGGIGMTLRRRRQRVLQQLA